MGTQRLWIMSGALAMLVGVLWTLSSLHSFSARRAILERRQADIRTLEDIRDTLHQQTAVVNLLADLPAPSVSDLTAALQTMAPDARVETRYRESEPVWEDWHAQRYDIALEPISWSRLGDVLTYLDAQRPPWRPVEIALVAEGPPDAEGRATLIVEVLTKR